VLVQAVALGSQRIQPGSSLLPALEKVVMVLVCLGKLLLENQVVQ
jgi:hypothetical protein